MPQQTGKYTAADLAGPTQQGAYSAADIATPDTPQPPNSFLGGVGRRLASMVPSQPPSAADSIMNLPFLQPLKVAAGLAQSEKQLGPQLIQQTKGALAADAAKPAWQRALPGLEDAQVATTGLSMLDPFASGSVANVNQLQSEGRGREAAGQGLTDAALLAAGLAAPKILPAAGKAAAPVVRGGIKVLNKAVSPATIGAAGGSMVAGPVGAAAGSEMLPEIFPGWAARAKEGLIPTPEWAAKPTPQMNLFKQTPKLGNSPLSIPQGKPTPFSAQAEASPQMPAPESAPVQSPATPSNMKGYYGETAGKSSLKGNRRQLTGPTASTAPNPSTPTPQTAHPPEIMQILQKPGEISDADMNTLQNYFAKQRLSKLLSGGSTPQQPSFSLADMLQKAVGQ